MRKQDSCWSNVVCLCATLSQAFIMGIAQGSFGVFLPVIMEEFDSSRGETGEYYVHVPFVLFPSKSRAFFFPASRPSCKTRTRRPWGQSWSHLEFLFHRLWFNFHRGEEFSSYHRVFLSATIDLKQADLVCRNLASFLFPLLTTLERSGLLDETSPKCTAEISEGGREICLTGCPAPQFVHE